MFSIISLVHILVHLFFFGDLWDLLPPLTSVSHTDHSSDVDLPNRSYIIPSQRWKALQSIDYSLWMQDCSCLCFGYTLHLSLLLSEYVSDVCTILVLASPAFYFSCGIVTIWFDFIFFCGWQLDLHDMTFSIFSFFVVLFFSGKKNVFSLTTYSCCMFAT